MSAVRILHISTSDSEGGSGRSARRIHDHLRRLGHESHMLVGHKAGSDGDVDEVHGGGAARIADRVAEAVTSRLGLQYAWYPSGRRVRRHPWRRGAEIVQLYNLHGGYFSVGMLPALARGARLVWRLSDMWPVTGHCAYSGACERWRAGCGRCPDLAAYPPVAIDTTAMLWRRKRAAYRRAHPVIVAPSSWTEAIARQSPLFQGLDVVRIANGVDLGVFRAIDKHAARAILDLPPDRTLVMFSAHVVDNNGRKGSADAIAALNRLGPRPNLSVVLLGLGGESWARQVPQDVIRLGYVRDERLLAAAYAAADMVVAPSSVENLPNSILEAMACAVPVVSYRTGGIADAVRDGETGLLADAGDTDALARAMASLADDPARRTALGRAAMTLIHRDFDAAREARDFSDLYRQILQPAQPIVAP